MKHQFLHQRRLKPRRWCLFVYRCTSWTNLDNPEWVEDFVTEYQEVLYREGLTAADKWAAVEAKSQLKHIGLFLVQAAIGVGIWVLKNFRPKSD